MTPAHSTRWRLALLAFLLAGLVVVLPAGRTTLGPALLFLSPNTDDGLTLAESLDRLRDPAHVRSRHLATTIVRQLALGPGTIHDAIGDWEGGVENSLLVVLPEVPRLETLRHAAAWFGLVAEQKAVLAFRPEAGGDDVLTTIDLTLDVVAVRELLDRHEIYQRTILIRGDGCRVFILDEGGGVQHRVRVLVAAVRRPAEQQRGRCEALSGATREEARQRYRQVLREGRLAVKVTDD